MYEIIIEDRKIGNNHPCFIIAEAGVNHNGSLELALRLVDAAVAAGADGVKFQLYRSEEQVSHSAHTASYQYRQTQTSSMLQMSKDYDLPWEAHRIIAEYCRNLGIAYIASCFDSLAVQLVLDLKGSCIKVGSGEITNYPLLKCIADSGLPVLLSTGMSTLQDVAGAVEHIRQYGDNKIVLFQCVSSYPAEPSSINLRAMSSMASALGTLAAFSDHTEGNIVGVAAAALGACMIEKHFTLDKNLPGPDHAMSLCPVELKHFVDAIRIAESALGDGIKRPHPTEIPIRTTARRSLVSARPIAAGEILDHTNVTLKRPATGIDPRLWDAIKGRTAKQDIAQDIPITWEMLL